MRRLDTILDRLRATGDVFETAPGLVGLRGQALVRLREIDQALAERCVAETRDEWAVPAALPLEVLRRARYFEQFPQWLTTATPYESAEPEAALPTAVCYHVYAALADDTVAAPRIVTAQGCCWRHEAGHFAPLARGWAFTMRELVCIGTEAQCRAFRDRGMAMALGFARRLGLRGEIVPAEDPFFAPSRGRQLLQRLKGLKQELRFPVADDSTVAAASFNLHERFFGDAFGIRLPDGTPAYTACVAFGLERWLLASLAASWPVEREEVFA